MVLQIRRTATPDNPPTGLAQGQLSIEMASDPMRLWVGVPTTVDPSGVRELVGRAPPAGAPAPAGGLLTFLGETELNFGRFRGAFIKHNGRLHIISPEGVTIRNTAVLIDDVIGNLQPNTLYYIFLTDLGDGVLVPNLIPKTAPSPMHSPSLQDGNEDAEVLDRGDIFFSRTNLLMNPDNGNIVDQSRHDFAIAMAGTSAPVISTATPPPGMTSSIEFPPGGAGAVITLPPNRPEFQFLGFDFTIEFFIRPAASNASLVTFGGGTQGLQLILESDSVLRLYCSTQAGATWDICNTRFGAALPLNQWSHVAVYRSGSNFFGAVNGQVTHIVESSSLLFLATDSLAIGGRSDLSWGSFRGHLAGVRITLGQARYAGAGQFTSPVLPFMLGQLQNQDQSLIGMVRTTSAGGFRDSQDFRWVASWFNRRPRNLRGTAIQSATTSVGAWALMGSRVDFLSWDGDAIFANMTGAQVVAQSGALTGYTTVLLDSNSHLNLGTTGSYAAQVGVGYTAANSGVFAAAEGWRHMIYAAQVTGGTARFDGRVEGAVLI